MDFHARRAALRRQLEAEGLDAFAIINLESSDSLNLVYLTGFSGTFGLLVLTQAEQLLLTDSRYTERAKAEAPQVEVREIKGNWAERLAEELKALGLKRLGLNSRTISLFDFNLLKEKAPEVELVPLEGPVERLRLRKDEEEIEQIREAAALTDRAFAHALEFVRPGMTELEVAWELEKFMREHGSSQGLAFPSIIATGSNSALPHALPGERRLRRGELLLLDMGARSGGYCADLTRMIALGKPTKRQKEVYEIVLRAQQAALSGIKAGMDGIEADRLAREVIQGAGFGDKFGHGLGHGVGLAVHEGPRLSPLADPKKDILEPGMVVTVEPGIYLVGEFGVRIEDLTVVSDGGLEVLSKAPKDLRSV
ncbi:MAG: Xaa-Pro peptidase family protein [Candidatus Acetothermia bacterium]|nr:Xaa-Pro peptidase family protein [Candidatus Acetothermia bacterium]MDH7506045.1 Xaa-Pro peptidase family protein [Candidatus Acetothermia bacterium]